jgi:hypothetical protein
MHISFKDANILLNILVLIPNEEQPGLCELQHSVSLKWLDY